LNEWGFCRPAGACERGGASVPGTYAARLPTSRPFGAERRKQKREDYHFIVEPIEICSLRLEEDKHIFLYLYIPIFLNYPLPSVLDFIILFAND
jgi:hypothetical protein